MRFLGEVGCYRVSYEVFGRGGILEDVVRLDVKGWFDVWDVGGF